MSVINEFKMIGYCNQETEIKITDNHKKIAYSVILPINSENTLIPIIAFGDTAVKLKYLGKKGNMLMIYGSITSSIKIINTERVLVPMLVVNEISVMDLAPPTKISDRDFSDLFKLYDLPKYIAPPIKKGDKK